MSPRSQLTRRARGGPRFRRLVDQWHGERRERTPMQHGTRVASIEAAIGGDMTPGRDARWTYLGPLDQEAPDQEAPGQEQELEEPDVDEPDGPEVEDEEPEP